MNRIIVRFVFLYYSPERPVFPDILHDLKNINYIIPIIMRKQRLIWALILLMSGFGSIAQNKSQTLCRYEVPQTSWNESFGNHRAVLRVDELSQVVALDFTWRRPDKNVDQSRLLIVNAVTGDTVQNIRYWCSQLPAYRQTSTCGPEREFPWSRCSRSGRTSWPQRQPSHR